MASFTSRPSTTMNPSRTKEFTSLITLARDAFKASCSSFSLTMAIVWVPAKEKYQSTRVGVYGLTKNSSRTATEPPPPPPPHFIHHHTSPSITPFEVLTWSTTHTWTWQTVLSVFHQREWTDKMTCAVRHSCPIPWYLDLDSPRGIRVVFQLVKAYTRFSVFQLLFNLDAKNIVQVHLLGCTRKKGYYQKNTRGLLYLIICLQWNASKAHDKMCKIKI